MSKLTKRCFICGKALTEEEAMMSEACSECIKNVKPVPPTEVRFMNPAEIKFKHMDEALYTDTQAKLVDVLDGMKNLLLYKNRKYGDSAINPKKVFYKGDSTNSILIRLDDKIGRVMSNPDDKPRVNDVADIIGYCTLLLVSMGVTSEDLKMYMD